MSAITAGSILAQSIGLLPLFNLNTTLSPPIYLPSPNVQPLRQQHEQQRNKDNKSTTNHQTLSQAIHPLNLTKLNELFILVMLNLMTSWPNTIHIPIYVYLLLFKMYFNIENLYYSKKYYVFSRIMIKGRDRGLILVAERYKLKTNHIWIAVHIRRKRTTYHNTIP